MVSTRFMYTWMLIWGVLAFSFGFGWGLIAAGHP